MDTLTTDRIEKQRSTPSSAVPSVAGAHRLPGIRRSGSAPSSPNRFEAGARRARPDHDQGLRPHDHGHHDRAHGARSACSRGAGIRGVRSPARASSTNP